MEFVAVLWIVMAIVCAIVGNSKGRSGIAYFFGGLLCWPIALALAIVAKPTKAAGDDGGRALPLSGDDEARYEEMVANGVTPEDARKYIAQDKATARMKRERAAKKAQEATGGIADVYAGADPIESVYAGESTDPH